MSQLNTRQIIEEIIEGMHQAGSILTISGVAKEAGVSNSTIHNRYPDLAEKIRGLANKATQKDSKVALEKRRGKIKAAKERINKLMQEIKGIKEALSDSRSVNAALQLENESLHTKINELKELNKAYIAELNEK